MKSLIEFLQPIYEGVNTSMFEKYIDTIQSYASKHNIFVSKQVKTLTASGKRFLCVYMFSVQKNVGANIMWELSGNHTYVHAVSFVDDNNKYYNAMLNGDGYMLPLFVELKDMSVATLLPFLVNTLNDGKINVKQVQNDLLELVRSHGMYEGLEGECGDVVNEEHVNEERTEREIAMNKARAKIRYYKERGQTDHPKYLEAVKAMEEFANNSVVVKKNVKAKIDSELKEIEPQENEYLMKATPEERFNDMEHYISMVLKGLQPSLLICGAPGVGKTFRVMKKIKASGLNYKVVKGKETAVACYQDLFLYSREGDILIFDDADDVLNDEVITNLLKAATDSSDERIVSYGTSKPPLMTQEEFMSLPLELQSQCSIQEISKNGQTYFYPKSFVTNGRVIIITNKNAGQVDTAVRNRSLVCDLSFTVEECLEIIRTLLAHIMPNKLSNDAKSKALVYLEGLASKGSKMEISIRSFTTVAKVYEDVEDDTQAERMIREQMYLQSLRGGKKY